MNTIDTCGISETHDFHTLWKLPRLPLTERFGSYRRSDELAFDQELVISVPTGHVQLRHQLNSDTLYSEAHYSFRTTVSKTARSGVKVFLEFLNRAAGGRAFESLADVGGNDLFVAREFAGCIPHRAVIDPICRSIDSETVDGIRVFGRFIENVDLSGEMVPPDLLICRHTLEHIACPKDVIRQWFKQCNPSCLYVVEIPCFENLVESFRFDAILHQHYHYYDLGSFRRLLYECGGEYLCHEYNHQGSCGGTLLIAFRRAVEPQPKISLDLEARIAYYEQRISGYRQQAAIMGELLNQLPKPIYGYGAGLMLATLGYHLRADFSLLECILDDDAAKDGATYENLPVTVRHAAKINIPKNSSYIVTSLENLRQIYCRIQELTPRRILVPLIH
jgi:hypothetical protein